MALGLMHRTSWFFIFKASLYSFSLFLLACDSKADTVSLTLGKELFQVELAVTPETRSKGLMYRRDLPPHRGMLFIFEEDQKPSFWMKNTYIPLSIAFISKDGVIKEIFDMMPESLRPVQSTYEVRFALEVSQGAFQRAGVKVGDRIDLPWEVLRYVR
ncbi:MAG: DUF192 domain-containing protein [Spirochaetales bacterium]